MHKFKKYIYTQSATFHKNQTLFGYALMNAIKRSVSKKKNSITMNGVAPNL